MRKSLSAPLSGRLPSDTCAPFVVVVVVVIDVMAACWARCAGFDKVDVDAAQALGLTVARVPAYR